MQSILSANEPSNRTQNIRSGFLSTLPSRRCRRRSTTRRPRSRRSAQLEDLLRRLGAVELNAGYAVDENGALRLVFPTPTWEDYLTLAFDEIRHFGSNSVQVMRRMTAALVGLIETLPRVKNGWTRCNVYLEHLDRAIGASPFDVEDKIMARQQDRQGIGLSRHNVETK